MKCLPELDSIRGLAALGVVFWHYRGYFGAAPLGTWFYPFYAAGEYFVDLFFVLSGFVLMRAYFTPQRREHLWQNLWQRIARLYPLHLLTLLITVAFTLTFMSPAALRDRFGTDFLLPLLVFPLMLYAVQHGSLFTRLLRTRPLAYLGEISYSVYLWHFPLQLLIMSMYCALNLPLDFWHPVTLLLLFVLIVLVSAFSYRFIEQPAQRWLRLHFRFHPST